MKIIPISILIPYKVVESKFYIWMQTRQSNDELDGLLEFPGGKVEKDESTLEAAIREVIEEADVDLPSEEIFFYKQYENSQTEKVIQLNIFLFNDEAGLFSRSGWHQLNTEDDLEVLISRIPPTNEIFLREFLKSNKFKMLVRI